MHTHVVNPKAITLGELYGAYHPATNEWQDGLASSIIRGVVAGGEDSADLQWVVFDGPVDTVWVEDMNTGEAWRVGQHQRPPRRLRLPDAQACWL